jgi:hypothetical protein
LQEEGEKPLNSVTSLVADSAASHMSSVNARTLDDLLAESVDEVLDGLFGRRAKEAIYDHMATHYSLAREEIPRSMDKFFKVTEKTFGEGSKTIYRSILKRLFKKLEWKFEEIPGFEFEDYLEAARARIARELVGKAKASMCSRRLE